MGVWGSGVPRALGDIHLFVPTSSFATLGGLFGGNVVEILSRYLGDCHAHEKPGIEGPCSSDRLNVRMNAPSEIGGCERSPRCGGSDLIGCQTRESRIGKDTPDETCHSLGCPRILAARPVEKLSWFGRKHSDRSFPAMAGESGREAVWFKTPPVRPEQAGKLRPPPNPQRAHRFRLNPFPVFLLFTLTFHFNYGSLCFQASFWPLWQEGDAYVVAYSCHGYLWTHLRPFSLGILMVRNHP